MLLSLLACYFSVVTLLTLALAFRLDYLEQKEKESREVSDSPLTFWWREDTSPNVSLPWHQTTVQLPLAIRNGRAEIVEPR